MQLLIRYIMKEWLIFDIIFCFIKISETMLIRSFSMSIINNLRASNFVFKTLQSSKLQCNNSRFNFSQTSQSRDKKPNSQVVTYVPVRPLKKHLTALYVEKEFLNRGVLMKRTPYWPYLTPFYAMIINNFLTQWSLFNTSIASILLLLGLVLRIPPSLKREHQIIKLQCNNQMTKMYITLHYSFLTSSIEKQYPKSYKSHQDWNVFTEEDMKHTEYVPTEADRRTFTEEELERKKEEFDNKLFQKIIQEDDIKMTVGRFELDVAKTIFKLSNRHDENISDVEIIHPPIINVEEMLHIPFKYLIVRTEFIYKRTNKHIHFFMDLEKNGDLKYHDYLVALGAHYKISLAEEIK